VAGLVNSFGDPTRRSLYLYLREHPGATANDLAQHCHVHPNVIRHHLERLISAGYVTTDEVRRSTVGRPAKVFASSTKSWPSTVRPDVTRYSSPYSSGP
jgi:predicted ArsR family transcriptional regulator